MEIVTVFVTWMTQLKIEAKIRHSITNTEVKLCLAKTSGQNYLMKTVEKDGFFRKWIIEHLLCLLVGLDLSSKLKFFACNGCHGCYLSKLIVIL